MVGDVTRERGSMDVGRWDLHDTAKSRDRKWYKREMDTTRTGTYGFLSRQLQVEFTEGETSVDYDVRREGSGFDRW